MRRPSKTTASVRNRFFLFMQVRLRKLGLHKHFFLDMDIQSVQIINLHNYNLLNKLLVFSFVIFFRSYRFNIETEALWHGNKGLGGQCPHRVANLTENR